MVKDDGKQWLLELTQNITSQLKEDRADISAIWDAIHKTREGHNMCREQMLSQLSLLDKEFVKKFADLDKRLEIAMMKIGVLISGLTIAGEFVLNHFFR